MNIIFLGTQEMSTACLKELMALGQQIKLLVSYELEPHEKLKNDTIEFAKKANIPHLIGNNINLPAIQNRIRDINPDLIIACGWRTIISNEVLSIPKKGTILLHGSLLPKYRGFAPITWPIINGDKETGITLFYVNERVDSGDIIGQIKYPIKEEDTSLIIYQKATKGAVSLMRKYIPLIEKNKAPRIKQNEKEAFYSFSRTPEDGLVDWNKPAVKIYNSIRALTKPYPGAFTYYQNKKLFIWKASLIKKKLMYCGINGQIGKIIKGKGVWVVTGKGILLLETIQPEGGGEINAGDYFKSLNVRLGYNTIKEIEKIKKRLDIKE